MEETAPVRYEDRIPDSRSAVDPAEHFLGIGELGGTPVGWTMLVVSIMV